MENYLQMVSQLLYKELPKLFGVVQAATVVLSRLEVIIGIVIASYKNCKDGL